MVTFIFTYALSIVLVLMVVTQIFIPLIFNKPLFWLFKKEKPKTNYDGSLEQLKTKVDDSIKSYNESKQEVKKVEEQIRKIKNKIN